MIQPIMKIAPLLSGSDGRNCCTPNFIFFSQFCTFKVTFYNFYYLRFCQFCIVMLLTFRGTLWGNTLSGTPVFFMIIHFIAFRELASERSSLFPITRSTPTRSIFMEHYVLSYELVPFGAVRHARSLCGEPHSAQDINLLGYCFKVLWVYAGSISAKVIYNQSFWYRSVVKKVAHSMSTYLSIFSHLYRGITHFVNKSWINPAFVWFGMSLEIPEDAFESEVVHV